MFQECSIKIHVQRNLVIFQDLLKKNIWLLSPLSNQFIFKKLVISENEKKFIESFLLMKMFLKVHAPQ